MSQTRKPSGSRGPEKQKQVPTGITLELKLVSNEENFWRGVNRLIDMMADDILRKAEAELKAKMPKPPDGHVGQILSEFESQGPFTKSPCPHCWLTS